TQVVVDLATISADDRSSRRVVPLAEERHDDRAVEVLVTARAQDADALQRRSQLRSCLVLLRREPIRERPIRVPETKTLDQLHFPQAPPIEVGERLRTRLQRLVIEVEHL